MWNAATAGTAGCARTVAPLELGQHETERLGGAHPGSPPSIADGPCGLVVPLPVDRVVQRECGISKAEFSVLVTLSQAPVPELRVGDLAVALVWDKSRVSHLLTRMEGGDLVTRVETGSSGRRTGVSLTPQGRHAPQAAITVHEDIIRGYFFDPLTPPQVDALKAWSESVVARDG